jgi:hypothetical protein
MNILFTFNKKTTLMGRLMVQSRPLQLEFLGFSNELSFIK